MSCPCPAYLPHLLNDNVESLYGDGVGVGGSSGLAGNHMGMCLGRG